MSFHDPGDSGKAGSFCRHCKQHFLPSDKVVGFGNVVTFYSNYVLFHEKCYKKISGIDNIKRLKYLCKCKGFGFMDLFSITEPVRHDLFFRSWSDDHFNICPVCFKKYIGKNYIEEIEEINKIQRK